MIDILSHHPAAAHFISLEVGPAFCGRRSAASFVDASWRKYFCAAMAIFEKSVRVMIESPEFWSQGAYHVKVKTPFEMVVSSLRATNANVESASHRQRIAAPR